MAHIRKYKSIPHTIIRAGYYYLNLRSNGSIIRISLKTSSFESAFQTISAIIKSIGKLYNLKLMDKAEIRSAIDSIRNRIEQNAVALIDLDSAQAEQALVRFQDYLSREISEQMQPSSTTIDSSSPHKAIKSLKEYKLDL